MNLVRRIFIDKDAAFVALDDWRARNPNTELDRYTARCIIVLALVRSFLARLLSVVSFVSVVIFIVV